MHCQGLDCTWINFKIVRNILHDHILVDDLVEEFEAVQVEDVDVSYLCPYQQLFTVVGQTAH